VSLAYELVKVGMQPWYCDNNCRMR